MPKDIDLTGRARSDLLARATGQTGRPIPPPPPAAPTIGKLPLPEGKVVGTTLPEYATPQERAALEAIGWTENVPVPAEMAELVDQVLKEKRASANEVLLPVDPAAPAFTPPPVRQLSELSPEEREQILTTLRQMLETHRQTELKKQEKESFERLSPAAQKVLSEVNRGIAKGQAQPEKAALLEIEDDRGVGPKTAGRDSSAGEDDRGAEQKTADRKPAPEPKPAGPAGASDTAATPQPAFCPHCLWDLSQPDIPEPPYADKISFLHAWLGGKCWSKQIDLFGGAVTAVFRALAPKEIDTIYKQAFSDRTSGRLVTELDFWERVNRYRMFLQLQQLRSNTVGDDGFLHDLPDGLSPATNPRGTAFWWREKDDVSLVDATPLPRIEEYIVTEVLRTEAIFRVVNNACNQFNRLVAKLEAMTYHSDFWKPTEAPS